MQKDVGHSKSCVLFVNPSTHCIEGKFEVEDPCHLAYALCLLPNENTNHATNSNNPTSLSGGQRPDEGDKQNALLAVGISEILLDSDEPHNGAICILSLSRVRPWHHRKRDLCSSGRCRQCLQFQHCSQGASSRRDNSSL